MARSRHNARRRPCACSGGWARQGRGRISTRLDRPLRVLRDRASHTETASGSEGGGRGLRIRPGDGRRGETRDGPADGRRRRRRASVQTQEAWGQTHTLDQGGRMWSGSGDRRHRRACAAARTLVRNRGRGPQKRERSDPQRRSPERAAFITETAFERAGSRKRASRIRHDQVGHPADETWRRLNRRDPERRPSA